MDKQHNFKLVAEAPEMNDIDFDDRNEAWGLLRFTLIQNYIVDKNVAEFTALLDLLQNLLIDKYKGDFDKIYKEIEEELGFKFDNDRSGMGWEKVKK